MNKKIGRRKEKPVQTICGNDYTIRNQIQGRIELGHEYFAVLDRATGHYNVTAEIEKLIKEVQGMLTPEQIEEGKLRKEISELRRAEQIKQKDLSEDNDIERLRAAVAELKRDGTVEKPKSKKAKVNNEPT